MKPKIFQKVLLIASPLFYVSASLIHLPVYATSTFTAKITSQNPYTWEGKALEFATIQITVTNTGTSKDDYYISNIAKPANDSGRMGWIYSPTPGLILDPGTSGVMYAKYDGFGDLPNQGGPQAGNYSVAITINSEMHNESEILNSSFSLTHPATDQETTNQLTPIQAPTNSPTWVYDTQFPTYRLAASDDGSVIATMPGFYAIGSYKTSGNLIVLDQSGKIRFSYPLGNPSSVTPFVSEWTAQDNAVDVTHDGSFIAVGTNAGQILLFDKTGKKLWEYTGYSDTNPLIPGALGKGIISSSEVDFSSDGSQLAAGTLTGNVYVFNTHSGTVSWTYHTAGQVRALQFLHDGSLLVGSGDNHLYKLDSAGNIVWKADLMFWPWERIATNTDETLIATGGKDGVLRVFDAKGDLLWSKTFFGYVQSYIIDKHNVVYAINGSSGVYAYDSKGTQLWHYTDQLVVGKLFLSAKGEFLTIGHGFNSQRNILALDTKTGNPVWQYALVSTTTNASPSNQASANTSPPAGTAQPGMSISTTPQKVLGQSTTYAPPSILAPSGATFYNAFVTQDGSIIANTDTGKIYFFKNVLADISAPSTSPTVISPQASNTNTSNTLYSSIVIGFIMFCCVYIVWWKRKALISLIKKDSPPQV